MFVFNRKFQHSLAGTLTCTPTLIRHQCSPVRAHYGQRHKCLALTPIGYLLSSRAQIRALPAQALLVTSASTRHHRTHVPVEFQIAQGAALDDLAAFENNTVLTVDEGALPMADHNHRFIT
jgi:hypothetical protein